MTKISFQGELGAYSHLACIEVFSDCTPIPCETFESALEHVHKGMSDYAMLPVENLCQSLPTIEPIVNLLSKFFRNSINGRQIAEAGG